MLALIGLLTAIATPNYAGMLRRDLRTLRWQGSSGLVLSGVGACTRIEYVLTGEVLTRRAASECGGERVVAVPLLGITHTGGRLDVAFSHQRATRCICRSLESTTTAPFWGPYSELVPSYSPRRYSLSVVK